MTKLTANILTAAAAAMLAATVASAETMKADIPFAFHVSGKAMAAGTYSVDYARINQSGLVPMRANNGDSVLALRTSSGDASKEWKDGKARLVFECGDTCTLVQIYRKGDDHAYYMSHPKYSSVGTRIAVVTMKSDKGD